MAKIGFGVQFYLPSVKLSVFTPLLTSPTLLCLFIKLAVTVRLTHYLNQDGRGESYTTYGFSAESGQTAGPEHCLITRGTRLRFILAFMLYFIGNQALPVTQNMDQIKTPSGSGHSIASPVVGSLRAGIFSIEPHPD